MSYQQANTSSYLAKYRVLNLILFALKPCQEIELRDDLEAFTPPTDLGLGLKVSIFRVCIYSQHCDSSKLLLTGPRNSCKATPSCKASFVPDSTIQQTLLPASLSPRLCGDSSVGGRVCNKAQPY